MKLYLSSTYLDLKRHRAVLARALRKSGYDVTMMEEYAARDQRVEFACMGDVVACDIYIGVFAWRYGHVPADDNPERLSVTEMEHQAAGAKPMPRLTFLLGEKARWPTARKDPDLARIGTLRERLQRVCSGYFASADELAIEVLAALRVHESTRIASQLEAIDVMLRAQELGPSYMMNIRDNLQVLGDADFVELRIGPTPWWNTRLHLVAALAEEFGRTRGFVFIGADGKYIMVASPSELRYRLASRWPFLEHAYSAFRTGAGGLEGVAASLWRYPQVASEALGQEERMGKHCLSQRDLEYELGIARAAEIVNVREKNQRFLQREVLGRQTRLVALVRDHQLEGIVDRDVLAQRVAQAVLM